MSHGIGRAQSFEEGRAKAGQVAGTRRLQRGGSGAVFCSIRQGGGLVSERERTPCPVCQQVNVGVGRRASASASWRPGTLP